MCVCGILLRASGYTLANQRAAMIGTENYDGMWDTIFFMYNIRFLFETSPWGRTRDRPLRFAQRCFECLG